MLRRTERNGNRFFVHFLPYMARGLRCHHRSALFGRIVLEVGRHSVRCIVLLLSRHGVRGKAERQGALETIMLGGTQEGEAQQRVAMPQLCEPEVVLRIAFACVLEVVLAVRGIIALIQEHEQPSETSILCLLDSSLQNAGTYGADSYRALFKIADYRVRLLSPAEIQGLMESLGQLKTVIGSKTEQASRFAKVMQHAVDALQDRWIPSVSLLDDGNVGSSVLTA